MDIDGFGIRLNRMEAALRAAGLLGNSVTSQVIAEIPATTEMVGDVSAAVSTLLEGFRDEMHVALGEFSEAVKVELASMRTDFDALKAHVDGSLASDVDDGEPKQGDDAKPGEGQDADQQQSEQKPTPSDDQQQGQQA